MHHLTAFRPRFGLAHARIFLSQLDYVYSIYWCCVVCVATFATPRSQIFSRFFFALSVEAFIVFFAFKRKQMHFRKVENGLASQNTCEHKNKTKNWTHSYDDWKTEMNGLKWIYISIDGSRLLCFWWPPPTTTRCKRKWIAQKKNSRKY